VIEVADVLSLEHHPKRSIRESPRSNPDNSPIRTCRCAGQRTGPCGCPWQIGSGKPIAHVRADAVAYMRTVAGRDDNPTVDLVSGNESGLAPVRKARFAF
jgi:hypothetical protein